METMGMRIKRLRMESGRTQEDLARDLNARGIKADRVYAGHIYLLHPKQAEPSRNT